MPCFASRGHWRSTVGGSLSFLIASGWLGGGLFSPLFRPVLVAGGLQLSLAFISPTAFPVFDWGCGGLAWSPSAGLCPTQIIALCTFSSTWCLFREGPVGWPPGEALARPLSHAALKMPQNQIIQSCPGFPQRRPFQLPILAAFLTLPTLQPRLTCSSKLFPGDLQTQTLCDLSLAPTAKSQVSLHTCPPAHPPQLVHLPEAVFLLAL